jgi:hypothetical protein
MTMLNPIGIAAFRLFDIAPSAVREQPIADARVRNDETKRVGLHAGYGSIERPDWKRTLALYCMYGALELWCWMAQIGNREPLAGLTRDLQHFL